MTNSVANIQILSGSVDWSNNITSALIAMGVPIESVFSHQNSSNFFHTKSPNTAVLVADMANDDEAMSSQLADYAQSPEMLDTTFILVSPNDRIEKNRAYMEHLGAYHLTRSMEISNLAAIVQTASKEYLNKTDLREDVSHRKSAIGHIVSGTFELRTIEEARNLSTMLSLVYPVPEDVAIGIFELIVNSIEHGNLEINFDKKSELIAHNKLHEEIENRLKRNPYKDRRVVINFSNEGTSIALTISDEGQGFNFAKYMNRGIVSPTASHGRGIYLSRKLCFHEVTFIGKGNTVHAVYHLSDHDLK